MTRNQLYAWDSDSQGYASVIISAGHNFSFKFQGSTLIFMKKLCSTSEYFKDYNQKPCIEKLSSENTSLVYYSRGSTVQSFLILTDEVTFCYRKTVTYLLVVTIQLFKNIWVIIFLLEFESKDT